MTARTLGRRARQPVTERAVKLKKDVGAAGQNLQPVTERLGKLRKDAGVAT